MVTTVIKTDKCARIKPSTYKGIIPHVLQSPNTLLTTTQDNSWQRVEAWEQKLWNTFLVSRNYNILHSTPLIAKERLDYNIKLKERKM